MVKIADINNQNTLAQSFLEKKIIEIINRNVDGIALVVTVVVGNIIGGIVLVGNEMLTVVQLGLDFKLNTKIGLDTTTTTNF